MACVCFPLRGCLYAILFAASVLYASLVVKGPLGYLAKGRIGTLRIHGRVAAWGKGTIAQPHIEAVCLLSERNSGSSWLAHLLDENLQLESFPCPNKHDYGMEVPSTLLALPPTVLVIVNVRNALDWVPSMHRAPWGATAHCNLTWDELLGAAWSPGALPEKLPDDAYILGPGSFQVSEERYKAEFPDRYCHKTENQTVRHTVVYERQDGRYASNVVTLRAWKARRAIELLQVRRQSILVRHEDVLADTAGWLSMLRKRYHLRAKSGFPAQVRTYKGEQDSKYVRHSELDFLRTGVGTSGYWNAETLRFLLDNLDPHLESTLGYNYARMVS